MKQLLFILLAAITITASAQNICSPTVVNDGNEKTCYLVLTNAFAKKYKIDQKVRSGVNEFNCVQTINGCWVTSCNSLNEFPNIFQDTVGDNPTRSFPTVYLSVGSFPTSGGSTSSDTGGGTATDTGGGTSSGTIEVQGGGKKGNNGPAADPTFTTSLLLPYAIRQAIDTTQPPDTSAQAQAVKFINELTNTAKLKDFQEWLYERVPAKEYQEKIAPLFDAYIRFKYQEWANKKK